MAEPLDLSQRFACAVFDLTLRGEMVGNGTLFSPRNVVVPLSVAKDPKHAYQVEFEPNIIRAATVAVEVPSLDVAILRLDGDQGPVVLQTPVAGNRLIDDIHLLHGILSVPECSAQRALVALGILPSDVHVARSAEDVRQISGCSFHSGRILGKSV